MRRRELTSAAAHRDRGRKRSDRPPAAIGSRECCRECAPRQSHRPPIELRIPCGPSTSSLTESERTFVSFILILRQQFCINLLRFGLARPEVGGGAQYAASDVARAPPTRRARWSPAALHIGAGAAFVRGKVTMTSNQAPDGGAFESAGTRRWDTGVTFVPR
jgi:hypothetical protein